MATYVVTIRGHAEHADGTDWFEVAAEGRSLDEAVLTAHARANAFCKQPREQAQEARDA